MIALIRKLTLCVCALALFSPPVGASPCNDDADLPDTGVGLELERLLGSAFITSPEYGTRCSTVLIMDAAGGVRFTERSYLADPEGRRRPGHYEDRSFAFSLEVTEPG